MTDLIAALKRKTWTRDKYLISTDSTLIPLKTLNEFYASKEIYWGLPLPEPALEVTLQNSLCFGLYVQHHTSPASAASTTGPSVLSAGTTDELAFIGLARLVTDFTTFVYLTDVYISPDHRDKGLGRWLMGCVREIVDAMPNLRRSLLITTNWEKSVPYYEELMGMNVLEGKRSDDGKSGEGFAVMGRKGRGHVDFAEED